MKKCVGTDLVKNFLLAHIQAIRRVPGLEDSSIVFIPEGNMGDTAENLWLHIKDLKKVFVLSEVPTSAGGSLYGVLTTSKTKCASVSVLSRYLSKGDICIHKNFVVANPFISDRKTAVASTARKLLTQLQRFSQIYHQGDDPRSNVEITYSGTVTAAGKISKTQKDDLVMALTLAGLWGENFYANRCSSLTPSDMSAMSHIPAVMGVY